MQLFWIKSTTNEWLPFHSVNLSGITAVGVYIIWYTGNPGRVVYVGQGDVAARIKAHRNNSEMTKYGPLYVTWASVASQADRDGIERYLEDTWHPLLGDAFPDVAPIAVNAPW